MTDNRDELMALADELDAFHTCADGDVDAGNGHFRLVCLSDPEQQRMNLRATLRETANALRSAASAAVPVAVKALIWPEQCKLGNRVHCDPLIGGIEQYCIAHYGAEVGSPIYRWARQGAAWSNPVDSYDAAKAAAQADYEQRIRSALVAAPQSFTSGHIAGQREMQERARHAVTELDCLYVNDERIPHAGIPADPESSAWREAVKAAEAAIASLPVSGGTDCRHKPGYDCRTGDRPCKCITDPSDPSPAPVGDVRDEIIRLMREDFDPHPNYELPAGQWDDNADDVADKIIAVALSTSKIHISDAWRVLKQWLAQYADEEATFSRYRDDVSLDGVMTARERRLLWDALTAGEKAGAVADDEPLSDRDLAMIDQAWENHKSALPVAVVINDNQPGRTAIIEITSSPPTLNVGTKLYAEPKAVSYSSTPSWACLARRQKLPEPADCNWPDCGCDPHATKVIGSLVEQGWQPTTPATSRDRLARETIHKCVAELDEQLTQTYSHYGRVALKGAIVRLQKIDAALQALGGPHE